MIIKSKLRYQKLLVIFFILLSLSFLHCGNSNYYSSPEEAIEKNIEFMNAENIEGTMTTIHPESESFETTENFLKQLFKVYDLNYKIERLEVVDENDQQAVVNFTQVTTKINGPDFKDNRIRGTHILRKDGDSWKIFSTKITETQYLN